jgi:hypothetical protein
MAAPWPEYKTYKELEEKLDDYFLHCKEEDEVPNIVGMALHCGFASRSSFRDYSLRSEEFAHVIKIAKSKCYQIKYQKAIKGELNVPVFIFDAVNNHDMFNTRSENKNDNETKLKGEVDGKWTVEFLNATPGSK